MRQIIPLNSFDISIKSIIKKMDVILDWSSGFAWMSLYRLNMTFLSGIGLCVIVVSRIFPYGMDKPNMPYQLLDV